MKRGVLCLAVFAFLGNLSLAFASECIGSNGVVISRPGECDRLDQKGSGGEIPDPFSLNSKVELSDGEYYLLIGRVVILPKPAGPRESRVFFEVDLREHPWLANAKRRADSSYPLEGGVTAWRKYENKTIKLACKAHGQIVNQGYGAEYVISIEGTQPPLDARR